MRSFVGEYDGFLTMFLYKNGVYYIDTLQDTVDAQGGETAEGGTDEIYIDIPDDKWNDFVPAPFLSDRKMHGAA